MIKRTLIFTMLFCTATFFSYAQEENLTKKIDSQHLTVKLDEKEKSNFDVFYSFNVCRCNNKK